MCQGAPFPGYVTPKYTGTHTHTRMHTQKALLNFVDFLQADVLVDFILTPALTCAPYASIVICLR